VVAAWLDRAEGLAAFHAGDEEDARRLLRAAADQDSTLAPELARVWADAALEDWDQGWKDRARERMATAVLLDPSTDPGPTLDATADYLQRHLRNYEAARPLYRRLYTERPAPASRHPMWVYRYGYNLELAGQVDRALEIYREFRKTWPMEPDQGRYVDWRFQHILMQKAREAWEAGDPEGALAYLDEARLKERRMYDQLERLELLAGQIEESRGEYAKAREHYELVLDYGEHITTDAVGTAQDALEALDERGF
jgi:tetratricopeptide (TPR) repeat protein